MSHRFISWAIKRRDSGSQMQEAGNPQDQRCLIVRYDRIEIRNEFASPHQTLSPHHASRSISIFVFDIFFSFSGLSLGARSDDFCSPLPMFREGLTCLNYGCTDLQGDPPIF